MCCNIVNLLSRQGMHSIHSIHWLSSCENETQICRRWRPKCFIILSHTESPAINHDNCLNLTRVEKFNLHLSCSISDFTGIKSATKKSDWLMTSRDVTRGCLCVSATRNNLEIHFRFLSWYKTFFKSFCLKQNTAGGSAHVTLTIVSYKQKLTLLFINFAGSLNSWITNQEIYLIVFYDIRPNKQF